MTCPSEQQVIAAALGELSPDQATLVGQHIAQCDACGEQMHAHCGLVALLRPDAADPGEAAVFSRRVMNRCGTAPKQVVPLYRRPWAYGSIAVAAAAAVWLSRPGTLTHEDAVAARGSVVRSSLDATPDVLLLRGSALLPIQDAELHPGDGITLRYWNPSDEPIYLTAFALDADATIHWIYPAYMDETQNPMSVRLERSVEGTLLAEAMEPENPANGRLRIVALLTPDPLTVRDVEARLTRGSHDLRRTFPTASVHEWNCTWNPR